MYSHRSPRARRSGRPTHKLVRIIGTLLGTALLTLLMPLGISPASAASVASVTLSGGATGTDGLPYAKSGSKMNATVVTDAAKCVALSGGLTDTRTSSSSQTSWTFSGSTGLAVPSDTDGVKTVLATAYDNQNCTNNSGTGRKTASASYGLDNTGPVATATLTPTANAAEWNNSLPVNITWKATDTGVGFDEICGGSSKTLNPCTVSVTTATAGTKLTTIATDKLGNQSTGSVTVKVDTALPTITGSRSPAQPSSGWNNTDVTVSFTCDDPKQGAKAGDPGFASGIKTCPSPTVLSTSLANQSVTGTAVDVADNATSATVSGINIDKVAPTVTGAATTNPNNAGWYKGDVSIVWTCNDPLSGLAGTCPGNSAINGEGPALSATSPSVSDRAGNNASGSVTGIKIDRTAPTTTTNPTPNWNNENVTVVLNASDALSQVKNTHYKLNGGAEQTGTSIPISGEGINTLEFWSVDNAGNVEAAKTVQVKIDKTKPSISHVQNPVANDNGWNKTNVTVTFTCTDDGGSGIASCTGPVTVTTEGRDQSVPGTAEDNAGNTADDPATVSIDKTKPTISATADRDANEHGWYNADVIVSFTCEDQEGLSGVAECTPAKTLGQGTNQSANGTATDAADNTDSASMTGINVDKTAPTLTGVAQDTPPNGWYKDDVTVIWSCSDTGGSGIDGTCPENSLVTGEGATKSASASVSDKAGNSTDTTLSGIKIDRTAPTTSATVPLPTHDPWHKAGVLVTLEADDNLSEVASTHYTVHGSEPQPYNNEPFTLNATSTVVFWSVDRAGNVEDKDEITVQIDDTKPTITAQRTAANLAGWNNGPVTVSFTCEDPESKVASCSGPTTLNDDGANQSVVGEGTDYVGNTSTLEVAGINIDRSAPTVGVTGVADGVTYLLGAVPAAGCVATDNGPSGIDGACTYSAIGGDTNGVGLFTYQASARDLAGNMTTVGGQYTVRYATTVVNVSTSFWLQPINDTAHTKGLTTSVFKAGSTVPAKFRLYDANGKIVQANTPPQWITPMKVGTTSAPIDESVITIPATSGTAFTWNATEQVYQFNWASPKSGAGNILRIGVILDDGTIQAVNIGLR